MSSRFQAMREPRHLLVLVGFICQGYSFHIGIPQGLTSDEVGVISYLLPLIYAAVWFFALLLRRQRKFLPAGAEELIALLAIFGAYMVGTYLAEIFHLSSLDLNRLIFIGNGLVAFQAVRLMRPLDLRERKYMIAVALIHLGVGTRYVVDYEFILYLAATLYLLPRSLFDLQLDQYRKIAGGRHAGLNRREFLYLAVIMVAFFLFFPRVPVHQNANPLNNFGGGQQPDSIDASEGGGEASDLLLFRIEGEQVDYVKSSALDIWTGQTWERSRWSMLPDRSIYGDVTDDLAARSVKVMQHNLLDDVVPIDGYLVRLEGPFVQRPYVADNGGVIMSFGMRANLSYRYWTELGDHPVDLDARAFERYTALPSPSPALQSWLDARVGGLQDPEEIANTLVNHFQANHEYELGAPSLDRLSPVDDFVINESSGHCERFASALAVLLRMKGIPARVGLGWVAAERNDIGDFYNVRARHGHAWTEAWIEGRGWVIFDATPYGDGFDLEARSLGLTVFEWIEYVWYGKVVEFGTSEQSSVVDLLGDTIQRAATLFVTYLVYVFLGVLLVSAFFAWRTWGGGFAWLQRWRRRGGQSHEEAVREARHFYGRMLRILAKGKLHRAPGQTPWEFLEQVEAQRPGVAADVRRLTQWFCDIRYGRRPVDSELRHNIQQTLGRITHKP